jgi:hypothetical protein
MPAYPSHPEIAEDTSALAAHYTSVLDLGEPRVAMHLRELELCLGAHALRKRRVSYYVSKRLSGGQSVSCDRFAGWRPGRPTVQARWPRRPSAWCGRGCCESWRSSRCRASLHGTGTWWRWGASIAADGRCAEVEMRMQSQACSQSSARELLRSGGRCSRSRLRLPGLYPKQQQRIVDLTLNNNERGQR